MRNAIHATKQVGFHSTKRDLDAEDMEIMELPVKFWPASISRMPEHSRCAEIVNKFVDTKCEALRDGSPSLFLFIGGSGTGKTSAASVMAKAARAFRYTVFFVDVTHFHAKIIKNKITADEDLGYRDRAMLTDVLVLDGLGRGSTSEFALTEISAVLKHRQENKKMTFVTTDLDYTQLKSMFGETFFEMMQAGMVEVPCVTAIDCT
jgi:DNA replication protein DnaC